MRLAYTSVAMVIAIVTSLFSTALTAEEKRVGDYVIYYNAFNSTFLQPNIANSYKIPRSGTTGVINVAVHRHNPTNTPDPIKANIQGRAKNNLSQYEDLAFREIREDNAIYYLADFQFRPEENTELTFNIRLPGEANPIELKLDQKFHKE
ncbi:DUF4426 domain-containing protein [Kangiella sp. TOML190]|uniref:DUF4426 domain-containing protein n=1 Tax=Kangiella sp. TOML190 TaxID=2931351 RepID=UPI00203AB68C|nr:DUF4426 domain-containing protein [Kangiella sp. TOML190]